MSFVLTLTGVKRHLVAGSRLGSVLEEGPESMRFCERQEWFEGGDCQFCRRESCRPCSKAATGYILRSDNICSCLNRLPLHLHTSWKQRWHVAKEPNRAGVDWTHSTREARGHGRGEQAENRKAQDFHWLS